MGEDGYNTSLRKVQKSTVRRKKRKGGGKGSSYTQSTLDSKIQNRVRKSLVCVSDIVTESDKVVPGSDTTGHRELGNWLLTHLVSPPGPLAKGKKQGAVTPASGQPLPLIPKVSRALHVCPQLPLSLPPLGSAKLIHPWPSSPSSQPPPSGFSVPTIAGSCKDPGTGRLEELSQTQAGHMVHRKEISGPSPLEHLGTQAGHLVHRKEISGPSPLEHLGTKGGPGLRPPAPSPSLVHRGLERAVGNPRVSTGLLLPYPRFPFIMSLFHARCCYT